jgi:hypothetical protein
MTKIRALLALLPLVLWGLLLEPSVATAAATGHGVHAGQSLTKSTASAVDVNALTDQLLFRTSLADFMNAKYVLYPQYLDWSDDGCSVPVLKEPQRSQPGGYDFRAPCARHDFGYRNYLRQNRLTEPNRKIIDDNFKNDMYTVCARYTGWQSWKGVQCRLTAEVYYNAVRLVGAVPANAWPQWVINWFVRALPFRVL